MKIHFTDDEDKVFNVPRWLVRVEAENTVTLRVPLFTIWRMGLVLGAGFGAGMAVFLVVSTSIIPLIKVVTQ